MKIFRISTKTENVTYYTKRKLYIINTMKNLLFIYMSCLRIFVDTDMLFNCIIKLPMSSIVYWQIVKLSYKLCTIKSIRYVGTYIPEQLFELPDCRLVFNFYFWWKKIYKDIYLYYYRWMHQVHHHHHPGSCLFGRWLGDRNGSP